MPVYGIHLKIKIVFKILKSEISHQFWVSQMLLSSLLCACGTYISIIKAFRAEKITRKGLFDFQKLQSVTPLSLNSDEKFVVRKLDNYN